MTLWLAQVSAYHIMALDMRVYPIFRLNARRMEDLSIGYYFKYIFEL